MSESPPATCFTQRFLQPSPHGMLVGVHLPGPELGVPDAVMARLQPAERAFAQGLKPRRRITWVGGRLALAAALQALDLPRPPLLADDRGAPAMPPDAVGSVSHKDPVAVALVAARRQWTIGVDVELEAPSRERIARLVLTASERSEVEALPATQRWPELLLRFSLKEAIYKALDPHVRRYVGFQEVAVWPAADGTARFELDLANAEGPFVVEARWLRRRELLLSTVRVRPA